MKGLWRATLFAVASVLLIALVFPACGPSEFRLTTSNRPINGGSVTPSGGAYAKGAVAEITAVPGDGYRFDHWEGAAAGAAPTAQLTMDANKNVVAVFTRTYSLSVSASPGSSGKVTPAAGTFDEGARMTLLATPEQNYVFKEWTGDASGSSERTTVTMDSDKHITASFEKRKPSLTVQLEPPAGGITDPGSGIFEPGSQRMIAAVPAPGYRFDHWSGDASGTASPTTIVMDGDKTVKAHFTKVYTLTVSSSPSDGGAVTTKGGVYDAGAKLELNATPSFPYYFKNWSGSDDDTLNPGRVTMYGDRIVTAVFDRMTPGAPETVSGSMGALQVVSVPVQLNRSEWLQGEVVNGISPPIRVYIQDAFGNMVKDLGSSAQANFTFMAQPSGKYSIVFSNSNDSLRGSYSLTYTIYRLPRQ